MKKEMFDIEINGIMKKEKYENLFQKLEQRLKKQNNNLDKFISI